MSEAGGANATVTNPSQSHEEEVGGLLGTLDTTEADAAIAMAGLIQGLGQFDVLVGYIELAANNIQQGAARLEGLFAMLGIALPLTPQEIGMGGPANSLMLAQLLAVDDEGNSLLLPIITEALATMFATGEGGDGENPLLQHLSSLFDSMLNPEEGEVSPLQPLFDALNNHVFGVEGEGGLIGRLNEHVNGGGSGGMDMGLKGVLTLHHGVLRNELTSLGNSIKDEIEGLWRRLFGSRDDFSPEQGDDPRV